MKLLLDQNLSHRIIRLLAKIYPESVQVRALQMNEAADEEIWNYARQNDYSVVTLDADFHEYSILHGGPPLIIWLKCGNQPKNIILEKLLDNREGIQQAYENPDIWSVEIY